MNVPTVDRRLPSPLKLLEVDHCAIPILNLCFLPLLDIDPFDFVRDRYYC